MLITLIGWCLCTWLAPKAWGSIQFFRYEYPKLRQRSKKLIAYTDWYVGLDRSTLSLSELSEIECEGNLILRMHEKNWDYHGIIERRLERIRRGQDPRPAGPATRAHLRR